VFGAFAEQPSNICAPRRTTRGSDRSVFQMAPTARWLAALNSLFDSYARPTIKSCGTLSGKELSNRWRKTTSLTRLTTRCGMRRPTQEAADIVVIAIMPSAPGPAIVRCTVTGQERRRTGDRGIP
jgi:hypothetical protein